MLPYRPGLGILAWQAWVVLAVVSVLCSLLEVAERFAARAEVSEQVAVFLVGDGGAFCTYMNRSRGAVVIPWDREGQDNSALPWEIEFQWTYQRCEIKHTEWTGHLTDVEIRGNALCCK